VTRYAAVRGSPSGRRGVNSALPPHPPPPPPLLPPFLPPCTHLPLTLPSSLHSLPPVDPLSHTPPLRPHSPPAPRPLPLTPRPLPPSSVLHFGEMPKTLGTLEGEAHALLGPSLRITGPRPPRLSTCAAGQFPLGERKGREGGQTQLCYTHCSAFCSGSQPRLKVRRRGSASCAEQAAQGRCLEIES